MSRWFRCYDDLLDDPKVQRLPAHLFKTLMNLWCLASKHEGVLPRIEDIAFRLRMSDHDTRVQVDDLILAGLIDLDRNGTMRPHNWHERQYPSDTSKERTRKWRENKKKSGCDVAGDVTCDDGDGHGDGTDSDPDKRREEKKVPDASAREPDEAKAGQVEDLVRVGLGKGGVVSPEARRKAAARLAVENLDPLIAIYEAWPISRQARDPDALFISSAEKLWAQATPAVRDACTPAAARQPPEPVPRANARPSSALIASLSQRTRHVVPAH